jgi:hypothetical protein
MPTDKLGHPPPLVQSMIVADAIHRDASTGKKFILGTFNGIFAAKFPHRNPPFSMYLAITNGHGPTVLRLRIVEIDDPQSPIYESAHPVEMANPNEVLELTVGVQVVFPTPGDYRIQLFAGNEFLREVRLRVVHRPSAPPPVTP